jgi:trk system potassium uptake protein TrkH
MLWSIYFILTVLEILALLFIATMPFLDSLCTSLSTMPTGGFSPHPQSIGGYLNPKAELIVMVFMFLGGMNFILYYSLLRNPRRILADKEFQVYCLFIVLAISIITADLYIHKFATSLLEALRYGGFQCISFMTTTGFLF